MRVDFSDLNKACPKDSFSLPVINQLLNAVFGCGMFSFLDVYFGCNQIRMNPVDEDKTVFVTRKGVFFVIKSCHSVLRMPERLISVWF